MEGAKEQAAKVGVTQESGAKEDAINEMSTDVVDRAGDAAESAVDPADAEEAVDQGSPVGVLE
ncbi:unnamed protein product [Prunus armeniaca]